MRILRGFALLVLFAASARTSLAGDAETRVPPVLKSLGKQDKIHLVYFVPDDREPTANYEDKIRVLMTLVADLYATDFKAHGLQTSGLDFVFEEDSGKPRVHLLRGEHDAAHYSGRPNYDFNTQWRTILPEIEAVHGSAAEHFYVVFAETYDDGEARFEWPGGVALGGQVSPRGAGGLFSSWILRDEFCATTVERQLALLADMTPIKGRIALGNGQPDSPRFEFIEDGFGAVAHEVGHGLGLPHDQRQDHRYIMGNGFRKLRENYLAQSRDAEQIGFSPDNIRFLANSRFLGADPDFEDTEVPVANIEHPTELKLGTESFSLKITAKDDRALAALLLFSDTHGTVLGGAELSSTESTTEHILQFRALTRPTFQLTAKFIDRGGNISQAIVKIPVKD
jgi:hypothetical protein